MTDATPLLTYWVIVPEIGTDSVVAALRGSWLRSLDPAHVHYCVANATESSDASLHRLPIVREDSTPTVREDFFAQGVVKDVRAKERYNRFLRQKVLLMVEAMARLAAQRALDFAMLLDADTAVNVRSAQRLVAAIPGGGGRSVYTGRCLQAGIDHPALNSSRGRAGAYLRTEVARYIELQRLHVDVRWPAALPPSPGGGPGILLSRQLLMRVQPRLPTCEPLTAWMGMGPGNFVGGDSMLTRCFAMLGTRCDTEYDLGLALPGGCPFTHGCALPSLFRKNPPWFYLAAKRHAPGPSAKRARGFLPTDPLGLETPIEEAVAFHHVKPSMRSSGTGADPRCAVRMRADHAATAGWWGSSCLPHFCIAGAPASGSSQLLRLLLSHPEAVPPERAHLHFFRAVWRGWYHLFLPNWLNARQRVLIVFADELQGPDPSGALRRLWEHLRFGPPVFGTGGLGERERAEDEPASSPEAAARRCNATPETVVRLRELTADSIAQTDAQLRAAGREGVPTAWRVPRGASRTSRTSV